MVDVCRQAGRTPAFHGAAAGERAVTQIAKNLYAKFVGTSEGRRGLMFLMSGSVLAQAIPVAMMPILTRLLTPEDFGVLAVFTAICSIATVVATGRYEQAILIPPSEDDARYVTLLALTLAGVFSLAAGIVFLVFGAEIAEVVGHPDYAAWLVYVPVALFFLCGQQVLSVLFTRKKRFRAVAISMVAFQAVYQLASLAVGYFQLGSKGLIGSYILGNIIALAFFIGGLDREDSIFLKGFRLSGMTALAKRFRRFPQVLVFSHLLNAASLNMTSILFSSFFGLAAAGFYALAQRAARTPLSLIGQPYGQVFRQQASELLIRTGECRGFLIRALFRMTAFCIVPFAILYVIAPMAFAFVFGEEWRQAGNYVRVMTPMFFLQFVTSPLCYIVVLRERQFLDFCWQVGLFLGTVGSLYFGHKLNLSVEKTLGWFSTAYCAMYLVQIYLNWLVAGPNGGTRLSQNAT